MDKYKYSYLDDKGIYCYEGSDVLINKFNIRDENIFYKTERLYSSIRQSELNSCPLKGDFDFNYLKAIHHYLFQDLFYWAGKVRTVAIAKASMFCLPQYIEGYATDIFSKLKKDNYYKNYSKDAFIDAITNLLGDINALHPFREGNGRSTRIWLDLILKKELN